jgi:hypothetical protein
MLSRVRELAAALETDAAHLTAGKALMRRKSGHF